ncbi:hypothetical protein [Aliiroseovarius sediminis]|uniref:hypothetical protein n=1 Tax=Aliiroseovarius sediminis TaxID=2925839 RepID=UPI001F58DD66|nr:hypothetical protein [Aliiroseovarius sediminis]MCI2395729.1 hypothetical protein [Aliiroseovarius sediminis]
MTKHIEKIRFDGAECIVLRSSGGDLRLYSVKDIKAAFSQSSNHRIFSAVLGITPQKARNLLDAMGFDYLTTLAEEVSRGKTYRTVAGENAMDPSVLSRKLRAIGVHRTPGRPMKTATQADLARAIIRKKKATINSVSTFLGMHWKAGQRVLKQAGCMTSGATLVDQKYLERFCSKWLI